MNKFISLTVALLIFFTAQANDSTRLDKAEATAATEHKYILLNFSGSDWCVPCIKMKKTIFDTDTFRHFVADRLVWMNADFPRSKKNLSKKDIENNNQLAERYNQQGSFPLTLLLDEKGNIVKSWDGFPGISPEAFIKKIDDALNDHQRSHNNAAQKSAEVNGQPL